MRLFIILSTLALISCGKTKDLGTDSSFNKKVEMKSFVTISYEEGKSQLHKKLMNAVVEETFPTNFAQPIKEYEELGDFKMEERDLKNYKEKEITSTKVVFSFSDKTEIFFLADNIPFNEIPQKLGMTNSQDRSFKYLKNNFIRTNRGSVVFFVSVNHEDLILNDQNYYHAKFELKDKFSEKTVMLDSQKRFELEVGYNYFIQALRPQAYKHRAPGRNSGCAEAGTCGGCEYKRLVAGDFVKTEATSTSQLGLAVKVNGRVISEADTVSKIINTGALSIVLKPTEYSLNGGSLEILQQEAIGLSSAQSPYEVSPACTGNIATENVVRSAKAELAVTLKIWGRGEELRKIKL